jgi:ABC-2 type transport system ATP-binding protein
MNSTTPLDLPAINASGIVKRYGSNVALNGIDLHVPQGMIYGILGPNGAGKTTLLRILSTLIKPDSGNAEVMGYNVLSHPHDVRLAISMTGQFASLDEELTGRENLMLQAKLLGFRRMAGQRADDLLHAFDLEAAAQQQVKKYSGGMRRKLDIAASLVATPRILFLDEPTTGLDPKARKGIWRLIRALADQGVTILLTTQYLEEAEQLAERIAVIDHGKKIAEGTVRELKDKTSTNVLRISLINPQQADMAEEILASTLHTTVKINAEGAMLSAQTDSTALANVAINQVLAAGIELDSFATESASLEEVFFTLTGHGLNNDETTETGVINER